MQGSNDQNLEKICQRKYFGSGYYHWMKKSRNFCFTIVGLTFPGCPCAAKSKPLAGCSRSLASCHQVPGWSSTWGRCQSKTFTEPEQQETGTHLPPSEVTSSLHWHCSTLFTTSLNFVWELCPAMSGRCGFWICGKRCICCCGGDAPR